MGTESSTPPQSATASKPAEPSKVFARIAHVIDDYMLVVNKGTKDGVREGQRFLVFAIGSAIIDPESQKPLGRLEIIRGTGTVTHVQDTMATIRSDMKYAPERKVTRIREGRPAALAGLALPSAYVELMRGIPERIEEIELPASAHPFSSPAVGDFAKPL